MLIEWRVKGFSRFAFQIFVLRSIFRFFMQPIFYKKTIFFRITWRKHQFICFRNVIFMKNVVFRRKNQLNEKCKVKSEVKRNDVMAPKMAPKMAPFLKSYVLYISAAYFHLVRRWKGIWAIAISITCHVAITVAHCTLLAVAIHRETGTEGVETTIAVFRIDGLAILQNQGHEGSVSRRVMKVFGAFKCPSTSC